MSASFAPTGLLRPSWGLSPTTPGRGYSRVICCTSELEFLLLVVCKSYHAVIFFFDLLLHCWDWGEAGEAAKVKNTKEVLPLIHALKLHALLSSPGPAAQWWGRGGLPRHRALPWF